MQCGFQGTGHHHVASGEAVSQALPLIRALLGAHGEVPLLTWLGARDGEEREEETYQMMPEDMVRMKNVCF